MTGDELVRRVVAALARVPYADADIDEAAIERPCRRFLELLRRYEAGEVELLEELKRAGNAVVVAWRKAAAAASEERREAAA